MRRKLRISLVGIIILGLVFSIWHVAATRHQPTVRTFCNDAAEIEYVPAGCIVSRISLGVLAKNILNDPNTLQYWDPEKTRWLWQRK